MTHLKKPRRKSYGIQRTIEKIAKKNRSLRRLAELRASRAGGLKGKTATAIRNGKLSDSRELSVSLDELLGNNAPETPGKRAPNAAPLKDRDRGGSVGDVQCLGVRVDRYLGSKSGLNYVLRHQRSQLLGEQTEVWAGMEETAAQREVAYSRSVREGRHGTPAVRCESRLQRDLSTAANRGRRVVENLLWPRQTAGCSKLKSVEGKKRAKGLIYGEYPRRRR